MSEKLELAAYCGHAASRSALGERAPREEPDLERWGRGLERFGLEAGIRAAHAAARSVVGLWSERPDASIEHRGEASPGEQVAAVAEWIACPCEEHVREVLATLPSLPKKTFFDTHGDLGWTRAHDTAELLALAIRRPKFVAPTLALAARALAAEHPGLDAERSVRATSESALIAWALA